MCGFPDALLPLQDSQAPAQHRPVRQREKGDQARQYGNILLIYNHVTYHIDKTSKTFYQSYLLFEQQSPQSAVHLLTCGGVSSALLARMQKSADVVTDIRLLTYFTNFSLFLVSQNTTQCSCRSGLVKAYTTVLQQ